MSKALRLVYMLQSIPRKPASTSSRMLHTLLQKEGFTIDIRSVQRDLNELSSLFPDLQSDGNKDEVAWFWTKDCKILQIPAIDPAIALTFKLVEQFLSDQIPKSVKNILKPYFESSENILEELGTDKMATWTDKIRILPRTQPLKPATINEDVLNVIYQALFEEKQIEGHYKGRDKDKYRNYQLNPLGLIFRENAIYLVASIKQYQDTLHFALHRFNSCQLLDATIFKPDNFHLDNIIQSGSFDYADIENTTMKLIVIFDKEAAFHLLESPLSDDQVITTKRDGRIQITATVKDTRQLRWWLLGFGDQVEVVRPKKIKDEFIEISENFYQTYH